MATNAQKRSIIVAAALASVFLVVIPHQAQAAITEGSTFTFGTPTAIPVAFRSWNTLFPLLTTAIINSAVILFIILILVGGISYLTSAGDEAASTKAKKLLLDATVGLFLVLAMQAIAFTIIVWFGGSQYLQYIPRYPWTVLPSSTAQPSGTTAATKPVVPKGQQRDTMFTQNGKTYFYDGNSVYEVLTDPKTATNPSATTTTDAAGNTVYRLPDGTTVTQDKNGVYTVRNANNTISVIQPDGSSVTKDGSGVILDTIPAGVDGITKYNTVKAEINSRMLLTPLGDSLNANATRNIGGDGSITAE